MSSGWLDTSRGNIFVDLGGDSLSLPNRISFVDSLRDGELNLSQLRMREGISVASEIPMQADRAEAAALQSKSPWDRLMLPW
jgi:hypothetical protein